MVVEFGVSRAEMDEFLDKGESIFMRESYHPIIEANSNAVVVLKLMGGNLRVIASDFIITERVGIEIDSGVSMEKYDILDYLSHSDTPSKKNAEPSYFKIHIKR